MITTWLFAWQLTAAAAPGCSARELEAVNSALTLIARGDEAAVDGALASAIAAPSDSCMVVKLARVAMEGWREARSAAAYGGDPERLAPVRSSLNALERLKEDSGPAVEIEYAQTAIRAAVAAAQDERAELTLLLEHARDLAQRLSARGGRAVWPRSFNLLAGELWLEVDRYDDARAAFERAWRAEADPIAVIGVARAHARLGHRAAACEAYRQLRGAIDSWTDEALTYLRGCR